MQFPVEVMFNGSLDEEAIVYVTDGQDTETYPIRVIYRDTHAMVKLLGTDVSDTKPHIVVKQDDIDLYYKYGRRVDIGEESFTMNSVEKSNSGIGRILLQKS